MGLNRNIEHPHAVISLSHLNVKLTEFRSRLADADVRLAQKWSSLPISLLCSDIAGVINVHPELRMLSPEKIERIVKQRLKYWKNIPAYQGSYMYSKPVDWYLPDNHGDVGMGGRVYFDF